jgi:hypothetical protein
MKPELKTLLITIGFYVIYVIVALILHQYDPGGPCTPGLGIFMIFLLVPIGIIGFLASAIFIYIGRSHLKWSIWLHLSIPACFLLAMLFG